jgi:hypothetical protein
MLSKGFCTLGLMATLAPTLHADWKITTVVRSAHGQSVQTEYFKGALRRIDQFDDIQGHHSESIIVLDFNRLRQTVWNTNLQDYVVVRMSRSATSQPIGPELVIQRATVDTGERRDFFGRVARHLITEETLTNRGSNAPTTDSTTKIDGWYVDSELLPREKRGTAVHVLAVSNHRPLLRVNQTGPPPSGLAVWERQVSDYVLPNGSREVNERTIEVRELIEASLPNELFIPPAGFKRVITFSGDIPPTWKDCLRLEWECLQDWIADIFA